MADKDFLERAVFERAYALPNSAMDGTAGAVTLRLGGHIFEIRPGVAGSFLLHALAAFLLILQLRAWQQPLFSPIVPVDLVVLEPESFSPQPSRPAAPPQALRAAAPQRPKATTPPLPIPEAPKQQLASIEPPTGIAPPKAEPKPDALQDKLEALSKLRQADTDPRLNEGVGVSDRNVVSDGNATGPYTAYSVKDFIRAQVERRWNLDLKALGKRNMIIPIHVVLHRDGTVVKAEIVEERRYRFDPFYHSIALSARNAVLLSSPLALPEGNYDPVMDMTLNLNPRDTLR